MLFNCGQDKQLNMNTPKMECGCLHGGEIGNGCTRNPLTQCSVCVRVWVHILGGPQSVQLRNATTTATGCPYLFLMLVKHDSSVCKWTVVHCAVVSGLFVVSA